MAQRKRKARPSNRKKAAASFELTRIKLLYGLSGVFTFCVVGLLMARPAPLSAGEGSAAALAAQVQDPLDSVIRTDRGMDVGSWKTIVVERTDSLATASFHFAVLPQNSGDQIAIAAEWGRQKSFAGHPGELRISLVSGDPNLDPRGEKTIRLLVERLGTRLHFDESDIVWR